MKKIGILGLSLMLASAMLTGCGSSESSEPETLEDKIMEYAKNEVWTDSLSKLFVSSDLEGTPNVNCHGVVEAGEDNYKAYGKVSWTEYPDDKHRVDFKAYISVDENGELTYTEIDYD